MLQKVIPGFTVNTGEPPSKRPHIPHQDPVPVPPLTPPLRAHPTPLPPAPAVRVGLGDMLRETDRREAVKIRELPTFCSDCGMRTLKHTFEGYDAWGKGVYACPNME